MENELSKGTQFSDRRGYITHLNAPMQNRKGETQITGLMSIGAKDSNETRSFIISGKTYESFVSQGIAKKSVVYVTGYDHAKSYKNKAGETVNSIDSSIVRINIVKLAERAEAAPAA